MMFITTVAVAAAARRRRSLKEDEDTARALLAWSGAFSWLVGIVLSALVAGHTSDTRTAVAAGIVVSAAGVNVVCILMIIQDAVSVFARSDAETHAKIWRPALCTMITLLLDAVAWLLATHLDLMFVLPALVYTVSGGAAIAMAARGRKPRLAIKA